MPHSQPITLQQTVCKFHLDPQYHISHWGSTILGDSTLWERLKSMLDKLEQSGVIADAEGPTDWVNNLVITEKRNGALCLCLDPRPLNRAINRDHFEIPTPDEVQAKLAGKRVFSVFDKSNTYWHVRLTDESSHYTTFQTPCEWGLSRNRRCAHDPWWYDHRRGEWRRPR